MSDRAPPRAAPAAILLYDGVCNLCTGSVRWVIPRDPAGRIHFASLQSPVGRRLLEEAGGDPDALDSLALLEDGRLHQRSSAALRVLRHLKAPWPWFRILLLVPRPLRDLGYDLVARHRYRLFGRTEECMVPEPGIQLRFLDWGASPGEDTPVGGPAWE